jgi:hypothetical protein
MMLHQVICEHLMRNGHIDISESLIKVNSLGKFFSEPVKKILNFDTNTKEANLNETMFDMKKKPFVKINYILSKIRDKDVQPALEYNQVF